MAFGQFCVAHKWFFISQISQEMGSGVFSDYSNIQFVNISGIINSLDPGAGTITYRKEMMYLFSCRYPLQYLVNNTEMSVWVWRFFILCHLWELIKENRQSICNLMGFIDNGKTAFFSIKKHITEIWQCCWASRPKISENEWMNQNDKCNSELHNRKVEKDLQVFSSSPEFFQIIYSMFREHTWINML